MSHESSEKRVEHIWSTVSICAGVVVALVGGYFLYGWLTGRMTYQGLHGITIKTNASLCLVLCGTALALAVRPDPGPFRSWTARAMASLSFVIGGLTLLEHLFALDFGIDQLLAWEPPGAMGILHPNRMGPPGAICDTLAGAAIFLLLLRKPAVRAAQSLGLIVFLIALLGIIGYLYGVPGLYGAAKYTVIAWQTTVALLILGMGILFSHPSEGLMAPLTALDPGGVAARRLLVPAIVLPVFLGWLRLQGEASRLYEHEFGTTMLTFSWIVVFSCLIYQTGKRLGSLAATEQKAVKELQQTQTLLLEAERLSHTGAWEWDLVSDTWTFSDEWLSIHGTDSRTLTPDALLAIAHPEDRPAVSEAFLKLRQGLAPYRLEHRIIRQDSGAVRIVKAQGQYFKDRGAVVRVYGFVQDVTEQKRSEEALRESEQKFRAVFQQAAVGIGRVSFTDARWIDVNDTFCRMLGYSAEEMRATPWPEITHPDDVDLDLIPFREMSAGNLDSYSVEKRFIHKDGHHVWARLTLSVVLDREGKPDYEIAVIEDITTRKIAEDELRRTKEGLETRVRERTRELEQAYQNLTRETEERVSAVEDLRKNEQLLIQQSRLAAMGEMLGNIAHQWRQPLNILGLVVQQLPLTMELGGLTREALARDVDKAMQLILHMSQTINDFRDFLVEEKEEKPFSLNQAVLTTISLLEATLKNTDVALEVNQAEELFVSGHRNEFSQVLMNIITNARDAFRERKTASPRIFISIFAEGDKSVVTIADNAGGIPDAILGKVFDPYFTTKGPEKGTGIGLFMSKNIIEKSMHGSLTVKNTGEGAEFRIECTSARSFNA